MGLKEKIKNEIDSIPEECLPQIESYIKIVKNKEIKKDALKPLILKGNSII